MDHKLALTRTLKSIKFLDFQDENTLFVGYHINSMLNKFNKLTHGCVTFGTSEDDSSKNQERLNSLVLCIAEGVRFDIDILTWCNFENSLKKLMPVISEGYTYFPLPEFYSKEFI